jgi:hypothetical protein
MRGQIKLGQWRSFTARQVLAPPGGWYWGTDRQRDGEFFRAQITSAVFR